MAESPILQIKTRRKGRARTGRDVSCDHCGRLHYRKGHRLRTERPGAARFCSKSCFVQHDPAVLRLECSTCSTPFTRFRSQSNGKVDLFCSVACRNGFGRKTIRCMWPGCDTEVLCRSYDRKYRGRIVRVYKTAFTRGADYRKSVFCVHHEQRAAFYLGRHGDFRLTANRSAVLGDPEFEYDTRAISGKLVRAILFERAGLKCQACSVPLDWNAPPKTWQVDHVIPIFRGGKTKLSNLSVLCAACHNIKSAGEKSEVAKARHARGTRWMTHYEKDRLITALRLEIAECKARLDRVDTEIIQDETEPILEPRSIPPGGA